ncbi:hypothetical protein [Leptospira levettii]|uniref:hypothetical protein n=1 Tax=Leptospira levettii TaxID=2023178 RepID=UPI000F63B5B0|nr:hypothetical protein [Leptospira levettii]
MEFERVGVARVFASYDDLQMFPGYAGGDNIKGDPHTSIAVWPGKTNADKGSDSSNWWLCCPVHPWCSHHYVYFRPSTPVKDSLDTDEDEEAPSEDKDDFTSYLNERSKVLAQGRRGIHKGGTAKYGVIYRNGVWEEKTCSCDSDYNESDEQWLSNYIDWRLNNDHRS